MNTPEERAAFINAQVQMMIAERMIMEAENHEREQQGYSHAHGPEQWLAFYNKWDNVLGYNALVFFFREL
jgi:hypothetical protein